MRKPAIKYTELVALARKHRRGEYVMWESLAEAIKGRLVGFTGVGRINHTQRREKAVESKVGENNRYCKTKGEVANVLGVSRATLSKWESGKIVTLKKLRPPKQMRQQCSYVYDAMAVQSQIRKSYE